MTALMSKKVVYKGIQIADCEVETSREEGRRDNKTSDLHDEVVVESYIVGTSDSANVSDCLAYRSQEEGLKGRVREVPMPPRTKTVEKNHVRYFIPRAKWLIDSRLQ